MLNEKMEKTNDKIMDMCEERECDVEVFEDSNIEKCSFKNNDENDKQDDDISFISDIEFGLDDGMKSEEKRFKPSMKMVFRNNENNNDDDTPELLFDINMVKSEPNKILKEFSSLKTVNKLFKFGNLNDICIKSFTEVEIDPKYIEKRKSSNDTILKTGYLSLDYDHIGCSYYPEITNVIYVNMKRWFMDLCTTLPSYDCKKPIKVVGLLFSGGKDSTCRLLELLEQGEHVVPIINTFNSHYSTCLLIRDLSTVYNLSKIYETKKIKGKKTAILPLEHFKLAVMEEKDNNKLNACGNLRGKIETRDHGTLLDGEKMSLIIQTVKNLNLEPIAEKKWNRNMNVNIYDQLQKEQLIDSLDWILRTAMAKQKNREYGFITLYNDGKGNYWVKVSRGFSTALTESHSSLETLIEENVEFSKEETQKINSVLGLINKFYE